MIRSNALHDMLLLETAAAQWFARMSPKERQVYIKAHPRSKYAKNSGSVLAKQAHRLAGKSTARHNFHAKHASGNGRFAAMHQKIAGHHDQAIQHYAEADQHFENGDHRAGQAALQKGHAASKRAVDMHAALKTKRGETQQHNRAMRASKRAPGSMDMTGRMNSTDPVPRKTKPAAKPAAKRVDGGKTAPAGKPVFFQDDGKGKSGGVENRHRVGRRMKKDKPGTPHWD